MSEGKKVRFNPLHRLPAGLRKSFTRVPQWLLEGSGLSDPDHRVLLDLCRWCKPKAHTCDPKRDEIAARTGLAEPQVSKAFASLKKKGLIKVSDHSPRYDLTAIWKKARLHQGKSLYREVPNRVFDSWVKWNLSTKTLRFWMFVFNRWTTFDPVYLPNATIGRAIGAKDVKTIRKVVKDSKEFVTRKKPHRRGSAASFDPAPIAVFLKSGPMTPKKAKKTTESPPPVVPVGPSGFKPGMTQREMLLGIGISPEVLGEFFKNRSLEENPTNTLDTNSSPGAASESKESTSGS